MSFQEREYTYGSCTVRLSARQGVLVAVFGGFGVRVDELNAFLRHIGESTHDALATRILVDTRALRDLVGTPREALSIWAFTYPRPVALVVHDELHLTEVNMSSIARGALVRAFLSSSDALAWLGRSTARLREPSESRSSQRTKRPTVEERRALLRSMRKSLAPDDEPSPAPTPRPVIVLRRGSEPPDAT